MVRRIRRELNELSNPVYTDANYNFGKGKVEDEKKRDSSFGRYGEDPCQAIKLRNRPGSLVQSGPDETVTVLELPRLSQEIPDPGTASASQEAGPSKEPIEFVNVAFEPDGLRDHSSSESSSEYPRDTHPIYTNTDYDEQPEDDNSEPIDEPLYQNRGELATLNNPERPRLRTMDITEA